MMNDNDVTPPAQPHGGPLFSRERDRERDALLASFDAKIASIDEDVLGPLFARIDATLGPRQKQKRP